MKLVTKETLKKWNACESGYKTFCRLLPDGAALQDAGKALITSDHADYANWLWGKAREDDDYVEQTVVTSGNYGTATAGDYGTATAGYNGTATAGYYGTATACDRGAATAGDYGTATACDRGAATAGDYGTATAGNYGTATAGDRGCIVIRNHKSPFQMICASVDGSKIKPNTPYKLDDYGNFVELTK